MANSITGSFLIAVMILIPAPFTVARVVLPGISQISLGNGANKVNLTNVKGPVHDSVPWAPDGQCVQDKSASGTIWASAGRGLAVVVGDVASSLMLPSGNRCDLLASGSAHYTFQAVPLQCSPIPFFPLAGL